MQTMAFNKTQPTPPTVAQVVQWLRALPLLDAAQLKEVVGKLVPRFEQAKDLLKELVHRHWLTQFQADRLLRGRYQDL